MPDERRPRSRWGAVLTTPTRGRIALWVVLAFVWFLFLPQDLAMDPHHEQFSWLGAALWVAVLVWLLSCARTTWRRYRREHD
jgi:uncharacterized membrane protein